MPPPTLSSTLVATSTAQTPSVGGSGVHRRIQSGLKRVASSGTDLALSSCGGALDFSCVRVDPCVDLVLKRFVLSLRTSEAQISANQAELQRLKFTEDR